MWLITAYEGGFGLGGTSFYVNEGENASQIQVLTQGPLNTGSCILVGTDGDRFLNESEVVRHGHLYDNGLWVNPHFPEKMFLMFDETQYKLIEEGRHYIHETARLLGLSDQALRFFEKKKKRILNRKTTCKKSKNMVF